MQRILFVELLGGFGDALIALPAIEALGRSHPGATVSVLTSKAAAELLRHHPLIDEILVADNDAPRSVSALLSTRRFDVIVSDTCHSGIDRLIASSGATRCVINLWRHPPPDERVAERFLTILAEEELIRRDGAAPPARIHLTEQERRRAQRQTAEAAPPRIFFVVEAGMPIKEWPADRFVALGKILRREWGASLFIGETRTDRAMIITRAVGEGARLFQRGDLRALAALLEQMDLVVGPDTGPLRVAAAVGTPTLTLFGPSWAGRYGQPPPHASLQGAPACPVRVIEDFTRQPCWYRGRCSFPPQISCLEAISVEEVSRAASPLLESAGTP